jgi:hypothetical protein
MQPMRPQLRQGSRELGIGRRGGCGWWQFSGLSFVCRIEPDAYGFVIFRSVTITSVLCANLIPYTPSVDLSFPGLTNCALS